jgi:hypothetical protein
VQGECNVGTYIQLMKLTMQTCNSKSASLSSFLCAKCSPLGEMKVYAKVLEVLADFDVHAIN